MHSLNIIQRICGVGFDGQHDLSLSPVTFYSVSCLLPEEVELQRRCDRNRKRSKRRAISCPIHGCYLASTSQKFPLYADRAEQLRERGVGRRNSLLAVASQTSVLLTGEWLEAFWCDECQETKWYHVRKLDNGQYHVAIAPCQLWQQAIGVIHPTGNPSVSEFTRRQARATGTSLVKDFKFI